MKILVLTAFYPIPNVTHERMFVHVRNKYYMEYGIDVTVLNFDSSSDYVIDGVNVITLATYEKSNELYDIAVSHSANIRNHYRFLKKYENRFENLVFFFHGHEVMYLNRDYPEPYWYMKSHRLDKKILQDLYDFFKIKLWSWYYKKLAYKSEFVFVSEWMLNCLKKNMHIIEADLENHCHIINNSVGNFFEITDYDWESDKKYDFVTVRSNIDGSKYCIDIIIKLAEKFREQKFLIIGKGKFFDYYKKPENVDWIPNTVSHNEMKNYLDQSKCAIILTRCDAQGVMMCELAAYGIPVITSDIDVCYEIFDEIDNVALVSNSAEQVDIVEIKEKMFNECPYEKDRTYFAENTIAKEVKLYQKIIAKK